MCAWVHLLDDGLCTAGLALDELVDHLHGTLHLVLLALHAYLAHLPLREILQPSSTSNGQAWLV